MTDRNNLIRALTLARPALATTSYILAMTHFRFQGGQVEAYNEISAIRVAMDTELECCLPGDLLIKALNSFAGTDVSIVPHPKEAAVVLTSGRSNIKVPHLPVSDFPLIWPTMKGASVVELDNDMLTGIERCLAGAGNNPTHPAQMGVTLDVTPGGLAILYSTDNHTISSYATTSKIKLPADSPVILPGFFCEQVLAFAKAYKDEELDLHVGQGILMLQVGKVANVLSRIPVDLQPLDFPARIAKHKPKSKEMAAIPAGWDDAFSRAMLVLDKEPDKVTTVSWSRGQLTTISRSAMGEVTDTLEYTGPQPNQSIDLDPALIIRGSKHVSHLAFGPDTMLLMDSSGKFQHLIAYCGA